MTYWQDKVVVITGGSSGLGFAFASELATRDANIVLVSRDSMKLTAAAEQLAVRDRTLCLPSDITNQTDVDRLPEKVIAKFGRVDALINCAGKSARGDLLETSPEEFQLLWELNFLSLVRCTQAFAPALSETRGHVVNIGSLASKAAAKFLGPYACSKYPVAAFSQQLRLEVGDTFHVLLVCPGPIARPDAGIRYDNSNVPPAAKQPGGGARIKSLDPQRIVNATLKACEQRRLELILPGKARLLFCVAAISPSWGDWLLRKFTN